VNLNGCEPVTVVLRTVIGTSNRRRQVMDNPVGIGKAIAEAVGGEEAIRVIGEHILDYLNGGPDRGGEDVELGRRAGLNAGVVEFRWNVARKQLQDAAKGEKVRVAPPPSVKRDGTVEEAAASF